MAGHPLRMDSARTSAPGSRWVRFVHRSGERRFARAVRVLEAHAIDEVLPVLREADAAVAQGYTAAGFVAYEAAAAFDPALRTHAPGDVPLVWLALYPESAEGPATAGAVPMALDLSWKPSLSSTAYRAALGRIHDYIAAGDTYQVNFTYALEAEFDGDAEGLFTALSTMQSCDHAAYIDTGRFKILSVSPELFFRLDGDRIVTRPMKGTAPRGRWFEEDVARAEALVASAKERAENVMIVDMLRNDVGRIATPGTVRVDSLFDTERYDTVWQMTSTVSARTDASVPRIFEALFPSSSVTGAPKVRTMEIIRELEDRPRGVYCGAIGWWGPGRRAEFSVAIRTATVDTDRGRVVYPVGSGITGDSRVDAELAECRLKADVLVRRDSDFDLLESLRWDGEYFLLDEHLARLRRSAEYFAVPFDGEGIRAELLRRTGDFGAPHKVRLLLARSGSFRVEAEALRPLGVLRVTIARSPVDENDRFLYHKTTHREAYESARAACPEFDDVVLWNGRGDVTETTIANIAVRRGGRWYTPPVSSGLLAGVMRGHLLDSGELHEALIRLDELREAEDIRLLNSVRGWINVELDVPDAAGAEASLR